MTNRRGDNFATGRFRRGAFTMVEVIVVAVIMVILAAVILPRVVGNESRQARVTAEAVRNLLSAAGEREAMTSQAITLAFDADAPGGGRLSILSGATPGKALSPDPLVPPVSLNGMELERCAAGNVVLNRQHWQVPLKEGDPRPSVGLLLRQADGGRWLVSLPSEALAATMSEVPAAGEVPATQGAIDLDQTMGRDEPW